MHWRPERPLRVAATVNGPARWRGDPVPPSLVRRAPTLADFDAEWFTPDENAVLWAQYQRDGLAGFVPAPTHLADLSGDAVRVATTVLRAGWEPEDDVRLVGPDKPLGYIPFPALAGRLDPEELVRETHRRGVRACIWDPKAPSSHRRRVIPALCVVAWDPEALASLIAANASIVSEADWPVDAETFARRTLYQTVDRDTPMYDLLATAYADPRLFLPNVYAYATPPPSWTIERARRTPPIALGSL